MNEEILEIVKEIQSLQKDCEIFQLITDIKEEQQEQTRILLGLEEKMNISEVEINSIKNTTSKIDRIVNSISNTIRNI